MVRNLYILSLLFTASAVITLYFGVQIVPPFLAMLGWFFGLEAARKVSRLLDFVTYTIAILALFYTIDPVHYGLPWFALSAAGMLLVFLFRNAFLQSVGLTRFIVVDILGALLMLAGFVLGNVLTPVGWTGWAALAYPIAYSVFKALGAVLDYKALKPLSKVGYKVEIGKEAPLFTLKDQHEKMISLADYRNKNCVLLVFVRGDWCPSCHITLRSYERNKDKFQKYGVVVLAIGPDPVGVNAEMVRKLGVSYHILADEQSTCVQQYGIQTQDNNPMTKFEQGIPLPATFLLDRKGLVCYTSRADNPGEILNPEDIFPVLEKIAS